MFASAIAAQAQRCKIGSARTQLARGFGIRVLQVYLPACISRLTRSASREDAQQVAAENLADVVGAVSAVEQGLRDFGQVGGGVDALRESPR